MHEFLGYLILIAALVFVSYLMTGSEFWHWVDLLQP